MDEVVIEELECNECGGAVEASCPEHGDQEIAVIKGSRLRCIEWVYEYGEACGLPLTVVCKECDNEEVEL
jgi:hypothetical protein